MSLPTFTLEVGFGATPLLAAPTFTDLAADLETLNVSRGRQSEDDQAQTGTCRGTLIDTARKYDPNNAAGAFYPNVQPMRPVRVIATLDGTPYKIFYGWIDIQNGWVRIEDNAAAATVLVPCNDGFEILNNGRVFTRVFTLDYFDAVEFYGPSLHWSLNEGVGIGTAADASGNGNTGTYGAGVTRGVSGGLPGGATATSFNDTATANVVATSYKPFVRGSVRTFMGWANRAATTDFDGLFSSNGSNNTLLGVPGGGQDVNFNSSSSSGTAAWLAAWPGLSQWVHWALVYNDATLVAELFINGVSKGTRAMPGGAGNGYPVTNVLFAASETILSNSWNGVMQEVSIYEYGLTAAAIAALYAARLQTPPSSVVTTPGSALGSALTGARINDVLGTGDVSGNGIGSLPQWPTAWRSIDPGNATVQAVPQANDVSATPLQLIRDAELTEPGFFYFDGRGYACFRDRRSRPLAASQATFCDTHNTAGGRVLYDSLTTRRTAVVNDARATRAGGALQEATDTTSQGNLLTRSKDYSTQHLDDPSALAYAQWQLSLRKDSYEVVETLTLVPGTDSPTWLQILSRELNDRITLVRTPPGGGAALTEDYFIEGTSIDWGPGPEAKCVWRLSPAPAWNYWLAGTVGSSEAGTTTRAGY